MDHIDGHDLPEEDARLIAAFVEVLCRRRQEEAVREAQANERDWTDVAARAFARDWDNSEDAVYDTWREHYDVPER
jgi:hypothetical protein